MHISMVRRNWATRTQLNMVRRNWATRTQLNMVCRNWATHQQLHLPRVTATPKVTRVTEYQLTVV
jgi:hypothetical protein